MRPSKPNASVGRDGTSDPAESFLRDDRAIEGLPIRLVVALVVGVAALALMLNILGTIGTVGDTEVTAEIMEGQTVTADNRESLRIEVIDENGNDVEDATVLVSAGSAQLDGTLDKHTGTGDNEVSWDTDDWSLRADQDMGTLEIDVVPPSDSNYIDEQPNPEVIVTAD